MIRLTTFWLLLGALHPGQGIAKGGGPSQPLPAATVQSNPHTDLYGDALPEGALARMGTTRLRQESCLVTAVSPDGTMIVSGGPCSVRVWEASTGKFLREIKEEHYQLGRLVFAPDGQWLAEQSAKDTISLLDTRRGHVRRRLVDAGDPLTVSPNGGILATRTSNGPILLWDTISGKQTVRLEGHRQPVIRGAFTRDSRTLVTFGFDKKLCRWNVTTGKLQKSLAVPLARWRTLTLAPDGQTLAIAPLTGDILLLDTETGRQRAQLEGTAAGARSGIAFTPDGRILATNWLDVSPDDKIPDKGTLSLWDAATGKLLRRFAVPSVAVGPLEFMPDGRTLVSANGPVVRLWDSHTGQPLLRRPAHEEAISWLCFSPDGRSLISASYDGTVRLWGTGNGASRSTLTEHYRPIGGNVGLLPDGKSLLSSGSDGVLRLVDLAAGKEMHRLTTEQRPGVPRERDYQFIDLATDGRTAVAYSVRPHAPGDQGPHSLFDAWDLKTGNVLFHRPVERNILHFLQFSPDLSVYASYDSTFTSSGPSKLRGEKTAQVPGTAQVLLKETTTARRLLALPQPDYYGFRQAFTPDGRTLVTATYRMRRKNDENHFDQHTLHFWELATGKERLTIACPQAGYPFRFEQIVFAPHGRTLATTRGDCTIQLWDVATGAEILRRTGYDATADCLAFSHDGKLLASGHRDSTILLWDISAARSQSQDRAQPADERSVEAWFGELRDADAGKAYAALWKLVAAPGESVRIMRKHLVVAAGTPVKRIRELIEDLDSKEFARRRAASEALAGLEELPIPALQEALRSNPLTEKRQRIESLLAVPSIIRSPETLQAVRAVEALEQIGSSQARELLAKLTEGAPEARLTREAKASLDRLARRTTETR